MRRDDDQPLIVRVRAGDQVAARELFDRHSEGVLRLAYRMTRDETAAADCVQDTFIRVFRYLNGFRGGSSLATWIHSIGLSVTLAYLREKSKRDSIHLDLDVVEELPTHEIADGTDLKSHIAHALDQLPEIYRLPLVLHDLEGFTHIEIAERLAIAEGTSKSRLFEARRRMRVALEEFDPK